MDNKTKNERLSAMYPIPPSGTPWDADGLQFSLVKGSIGAFCSKQKLNLHNKDQNFAPQYYQPYMNK